MFWEAPTFYPFEQVNIEQTSLADPIRLFKFRFKAKKRNYLVTLEEYSFGVYSIKYCGLKDRKKGNAYSLVYNDRDSIKVICTCLQIMKHMWANNPNISFAFFAVPRTEKEVRKNKNARYDIYENAMINLFSPKYFKQYRDPKSRVYVLLNTNVKEKRKTINAIGKYLLAKFDVIFAPYQIDSKRKKWPDTYMRFG